MRINAGDGLIPGLVHDPSHTSPKSAGVAQIGTPPSSATCTFRSAGCPVLGDNRLVTAVRRQERVRRGARWTNTADRRRRGCHECAPKEDGGFLLVDSSEKRRRIPASAAGSGGIRPRLRRVLVESEGCWWNRCRSGVVKQEDVTRTSPPTARASRAIPIGTVG